MNIEKYIFAKLMCGDVYRVLRLRISDFYCQIVIDLFE